MWAEPAIIAVSSDANPKVQRRMSRLALIPATPRLVVCSIMPESSGEAQQRSSPECQTSLRMTTTWAWRIDERPRPMGGSRHRPHGTPADQDTVYMHAAV